MEGGVVCQFRHACATTTAAVRREIRHSQESLGALTKRYGIKPEDRGQVEEAKLYGRSADRSK